MNAVLQKRTVAYRFGPYVITGPRISRPSVKVLQLLTARVRSGELAVQVLVDVAGALGMGVAA
jgi:hypothetical protein